MLTMSFVRASIPLVKRAVVMNSSCMMIPSRFDHHGVPQHYKHPTMDELPIPCGSWQENYDNNQRKYNIHLLLGAGFFLISMISCYSAGAFELHLFAPDKPAPKKVV